VGVFLVKIFGKERRSERRNENIIVSGTLKILNNLKLVLFNLNKIKESIEFYNKAIQIDPNHALAFIKNGRSLIFLDKYNEAIECCLSFIQI